MFYEVELRKKSSSKVFELVTRSVTSFAKLDFVTREFRTSILYGWFWIWGICSNLIKCVIFFVIKTEASYILISTSLLYFNCFLIFFQYFFWDKKLNKIFICLIFWIPHNILPDLLNREVFKILFIVTQNAYQYDPVF